MRGMIEAHWHSKPVAKSLAILGDAVEFVHGRTDKSSWMGFRVSLTWEATKMLELDSRQITSRRELHRVARLYQEATKAQQTDALETGITDAMTEHYGPGWEE